MHTTPSGASRRVIDNDAWHFWGDAGDIVPSGYLFFKMLVHVLTYYVDTKGLDLDKISLFTDGSASQYKGRKNCFFLPDLAQAFGCVVDHTWAPTATFKGLHDAAGAEAKRVMRQLELNDTVGCRANSAEGVWRALQGHMRDPPPRDLDTCHLHTYTGRHHVLLVESALAEPHHVGMPDVLIVDAAAEAWDCTAVRGIRSKYNVRAYPPPGQNAGGAVELGTERQVHIREHPCACAPCRGRERERRR
jgi:hypothetical protein